MKRKKTRITLARAHPNTTSSSIVDLRDSVMYTRNVCHSHDKDTTPLLEPATTEYERQNAQIIPYRPHASTRRKTR